MGHFRHLMKGMPVDCKCNVHTLLMYTGNLRLAYFLSSLLLLLTLLVMSLLSLPFGVVAVTTLWTEIHVLFYLCHPTCTLKLLPPSQMAWNNSINIDFIITSVSVVTHWTPQVSGLLSRTILRKPWWHLMIHCLIFVPHGWTTSYQNYIIT